MPCRRTGSVRWFWEEERNCLEASELSWNTSRVSMVLAARQPSGALATSFGRRLPEKRGSPAVKNTPSRAKLLTKTQCRGKHLRTGPHSLRRSFVAESTKRSPHQPSVCWSAWSIEPQVQNNRTSHLWFAIRLFLQRSRCSEPLSILPSRKEDRKGGHVPRAPLPSKIHPSFLRSPSASVRFHRAVDVHQTHNPEALLRT